MHNKKLNVLIVSVNYNSEKYLELLISNTKTDENSDAKFCIVSNSGELLNPDKFKNCISIINGENLGFGKACNIGARVCDSKWLLFVNPDVLLNSDVIEKMIQCACLNPDYAVITVFSSNTIDKIFFEPSGKILDYSDRNFGACFLIDRDTFFSLGGFDENIFLWFEDTDLRDRVINSGKKVGCLDGVIVPHMQGHSTHHRTEIENKNLTEIWLQSHFYYRIKHNGIVNGLVWCVGMIFVNFIRTLLNKNLPLRPYFDTKVAVFSGFKLIYSIGKIKKKLRML